MAGSARKSRATRAAASVALVVYLCAAVRVHAQCVPPPPFTDSRVYYHLDQVGSVTLRTDHAGQVVQQTRYLPYGSGIIGQPIGSADAFGFTGHRNPETHGLSYFEARYYVPELAVFASRDPAAQFQNPYSYGEGDPLSVHDPDGKVFLPALLAGLFFVGELVLDDFLNPAPATPQEGLLTAEQQALQSAPMPFESGPRRLGSFGIRTVGIAQEAAGKGVAVADEVVEVAAKRGQTVLGHFEQGPDYPGYVEYAKSIGARYFDVPTVHWNRMSSAQQWAANERFLERAIARGDEIILSTPAAAARTPSSFARELQYLFDRGFTLADDGMRMLAPRP